MRVRMVGLRRVGRRCSPSRLVGTGLTYLLALQGLCGEGFAEDGARRSGTFEIRLAGAIGVFTNLAEAVEDTQAFRDSEISDFDLEMEPSVGFNAELGWRVHPRLTVAAHLEFMDDLSVNVERGRRASPEANNGLLTGDTLALTGDLRIHLLTETTIRPFVVLGAGWLWVNTDDEPAVRVSGIFARETELGPLDTGIGARDGFVARGGGGIDIHMSDAFFLTTQASYMVPVGRVRDFDYLSITWGFGYCF